MYKRQALLQAIFVRRKFSSEIRLNTAVSVHQMCIRDRDVEFTADMEKELDSVEEGELNWKKLINDFYPSFKDTLEKAQKNIEKIQIKDEESDVVCEKCRCV